MNAKEWIEKNGFDDVVVATYYLSSSTQEQDAIYYRVSDLIEMYCSDKGKLTTGKVREILDAQARGEITYGKMVQLLNTER